VSDIPKNEASKLFQRYIYFIDNSFLTLPFWRLLYRIWRSAAEMIDRRRPRSGWFITRLTERGSRRKLLWHRTAYRWYGTIDRLQQHSYTASDLLICPLRVTIHSLSLAGS